MKLSTKILTALSFLATFSTLLPMNPPVKKAAKWAKLAFEIAVFGVPRGTDIEKELTLPNDPTPFTGLPPELQKKIIVLIMSGAQTKKLEKATFCINSLAQVNKQLNEVINHPLYCFKIIRALAEKFNVSDQEACSQLRTQTAKIILKNQLTLQQLCYDQISSPSQEAELVKKYNTLLKEVINVNFTYGKNQTTALLAAAAQPNKTMVELLLNSGADPRIADKNGITPLGMATDFNSPSIQLIQEAIAAKNIS